MKKLVTFAVLILTCFALAKDGGNEGGHGGDPYAFEFVELASRIFAHLANPKYKDLIERYNINLPDLESLIRSERIYSREGEDVVLPNGNEVDMINFENKHEHLLNRTRWRVALLDQKLILVLHEYFGMKNIERDVYNVSVHFSDALIDLYNDLKKDSRSPVRYYGVAMGTPPLSYAGDPCDPTHPANISATANAQRAAVNNCLSEALSRQCKVISTTIRSIRSSEKIGFQYCEITAQAK